MAVREKTLTRSQRSVKRSAMPSSAYVIQHKNAASSRSEPDRRFSPITGHESDHDTRITSSNTCHTTPKSDSTDPPNASPPGSHAVLADKPPTLSPRHTASIPDTAPGSAPKDQPYPPPPAAPASESSHSSNAQTASYLEIPPASPTARRKTIHPPPDDPPS